MSQGDELAGRTALVTGASRGIGRSVAESLARAGAHVWCLARSTEAVRGLATQIGGEPLVVDLADDAAVWDGLDTLCDQLGHAPDIVVNAAGVFGTESFAAETLNAFDQNLTVNLRGPFVVLRTLLPRMLERGDGVIVNIGSVAGRQAFPGNAAYSASKYGLRGLHEVLLEETRGTGVRATLLEPAATDTSLWDELDPDQNPGLPDRAGMLRAEDVAQSVLFVVTRPPSVRISALQIEHS